MPESNVPELVRSESDSTRLFYENLQKQLDEGTITKEDYQNKLVRRELAHKLLIIRQKIKAETDVLTKIPNRRGMEEELRNVQKLADAGEIDLQLGIVDIDNFKKLINDQYGHAAGDLALKHIAQLLFDKTRDEDIVGRMRSTKNDPTGFNRTRNKRHVGRIGGEEFILVFTHPKGTDGEAENPITPAERLRQLIENTPLIVPGLGPVNLTVSIGCTTYQPHEGLPAALHRADDALYEAKRTGKNKTVSR